jgi:hypothetical protein
VNPDDRDRTYCRLHCKGFRDTGGLCFADGECEAYTKHMNHMNPARQAFEDELRQLLIDAWNAESVTLNVTQAADRLIELARRVINEE